VWLARKGDRAEDGEDDNGGGDHELEQLTSPIVALDRADVPRTRELLRYSMDDVRWEPREP
jgi:hypothetical protein